MRRRKASAPGAMESTDNVAPETFVSASNVVQSESPETSKSKPNIDVMQKDNNSNSSVKGQGAKTDHSKSELSPESCETVFFTPSVSFEGPKAMNSPLSSISEAESPEKQAKAVGGQEMAEMSESPRRTLGRVRHKSDGSSPAEQRDVLDSVQEILVEEDRDWKRVREH